MNVDETDEPSLSNGCLAMFVSVAFAALLMALGSPPVGYSLFLYPFVFISVTIIAASIGLPLRYIAVHLGIANAWTAVAIGAVSGAGLPALNAFSGGSDRDWINVAAYGAVGAASGLMFFLIGTAPRAPRRSVAAMLALAFSSIAAILLAQPQML